MPKFRKKPVVIEAVQFNGWELVDDVHTAMFDLAFGAPDWLHDAIANSETDASAVFLNFNLNPDDPQLTIVTLEGNHTASPGDWIIRGVQGELYPCKPDIFAATYEAVEG